MADKGTVRKIDRYPLTFTGKTTSPLASYIMPRYPFGTFRRMRLSPDVAPKEPWPGMDEGVRLILPPPSVGQLWPR